MFEQLGPLTAHSPPFMPHAVQVWVNAPACDDQGIKFLACGSAHCLVPARDGVNIDGMQGDAEASKSGAVLLTKDNNMMLKAQANGLKALTPAHFPASQPHLHRHLLAVTSTTSPVKQPPQPSPHRCHLQPP